MARHLLRPLALFEGSYGLLTLDAAVKTAIVFVHGFWGNADTTWQAFQTLVDSPEAVTAPFENCDLYFLDYPCAKQTIDASASQILEVLTTIYPTVAATSFKQPSSTLGSILELHSNYVTPDCTERSYDNLILIGHSAGAVVLRRVILQIAKAQIGSTEADHIARAQILKARLLLFSPAHLGFRLSKVMDSVSASFWPISIFTAGWQMTRGKCYIDLLPDSPVLTSIRDQTERAAESRKEVSALRADVLFGNDEDVVFRGEYSCDHSCAPIKGKGHTDVCKPTEDYLEPLEFLAEAINGQSPIQLGKFRRPVARLPRS